MGAHGVLGNEPGDIDYSLREAWNEATNVYLLVILVSFALLIYAKRSHLTGHQRFKVHLTDGGSKYCVSFFVIKVLLI